MQQHTPPPAAVELFDARPFFEKALIFGVQHGILNQARIEAICTEAPKGMVQIARYFGTEFLRPDLEKARDRLVNLVSLSLQSSSQGDLRMAAEILRDNSLLSRSKAGADMLKALIVMPQNTHFGMNERGDFSDRHIAQLDRWSCMGLTEYQTELAQRNQAALTVEAAFLLSDRLGLSADDLQDAEPDAEAVIRTALLAHATACHEMPDWVRFEKMIQSLRKQAIRKSLQLQPILDVPPRFESVLAHTLLSVQDDLPKILDTKIPVRTLFDQLPSFMGRYFWIEDALNEVDHHDRTQSATWQKLTQGHHDDGTVLTLLLCVASSSKPKTVLTEKAAASLIRKIRKQGLSSELATEFINRHAPLNFQSDFSQLWQDFLVHALPILCSDHDVKLNDALALLRHECNVK